MTLFGCQLFWILSFSWIMLPAKGQDCICQRSCSESGRFPDGRKVNVAYGKLANSSKLYGDSAACAAVNGKTDTEYKPGENCVHTVDGERNAWWLVDLGHIYTVSNITVYRRRGYAKRMTNMSVSVDNQLCHRFPNSSDNTALNALPEKIDIICSPPLTGQVVRFQKYTENTDEQYLTINICEVQVWVCTAGYVEPSCTCGHCANDVECNLQTHTCPSDCDPGWRTAYCNESCPNGQYGSECLEQCGYCQANATCDKVTGVCPADCDLGWRGPHCKDACSSGSYGDNCTMMCGHCREGTICNHVNGTCPEFCQPGFDPSDPFCNRACPDSKHGDNCTEICGNCLRNSVCDKINGSCPQGCQRQNKQPPFCKTCIDRKFGTDCAKNCSENCHGDGSCDVSSGNCSHGCKAGFTGSMCDNTCSNNTYGDNCRQECGHCNKSEPCNHITGMCSNGCAESYVGDLCSQKQEGLNDESVTNDKSGINTGVIAGPVVGGVVVIAAVILVVVFIVRRGKTKTTGRPPAENNKRPTDNDPNSSTHDTPPHFDPIATSAPQTTSKPMVAIKPTVVILPTKGQSDNADEADHTYYNTEQATASHRPTTSSAHSPSREISQKQASPSETTDPESYDDDLPLVEDDHLYGNEDGKVYASFQATQPKLDSVQKYLVDRLASGNLREEFSAIRTGRDDLPQTAALRPENFKKNRFASILPCHMVQRWIKRMNTVLLLCLVFSALAANYDRSRVILNDGYAENGATDFVNASYISGYFSQKQYIAAQGPRDNTVVDFWRTIWQGKIHHIVILTSVIERGNRKCEQYWPELEGEEESYGPFTVSIIHVECRDSFYVRTLSVKRLGSQETREVTQYHYSSWPDHGVPTTTSLVIFWRFVSGKTGKLKKSTPAQPILVHCSAGVGRTGTYIGLDLGMDMAVTEGSIDVLDLVNRLRDERCWMIQAAEQFVFLHKALLEAYTAHGTNIAVDQFDVTYPQSISFSKPQSRIDKEYQSLTQMLTLTPEPRYDTAKLKENVQKNRSMDVLPADEHLVYLTEHISGRNQYINAVFMPTFRDPRGNILTQLPLPSTLVDFWRLVYGNDVTTVVSLSSPAEEQEKKSRCQYWPLNEGETLNAGPYFVILQSKAEDRTFDMISYRLLLGKQGVEEPRVVRVVHYMGWKDEVGGNSSNILHFIDTLVTSHISSTTRRMVVQCCDGVGKSGLFCALCDIISRMTYDREVDVYMTVRHVQSVSPKAVSSAVQYRYCYQVVQSRVREMSVYANT